MYRIPLALVALVLIVLGVFLYLEPTTNEYSSDLYGISFSYPEGYHMTEGTVGNDHYSIRLVKEEDAAPPEDGEGPTGVTIDLYTHNTLSLSEWVATSNFSNVSLGDKSTTPTTVDGVPAVSYHWSGLFEGETTAFLQGETVLAVSVLRLSPEDHTEAYQEVLSSLTLK